MSILARTGLRENHELIDLNIKVRWSIL